jgi:uncharacterized protein YcbK (DUF882 family)
VSFKLSIHNLSRRSFITSSAVFVAGVFISVPFSGMASQPQYHSLSFLHTHTGERLNLNFNFKKCRPDNPKALYHFLRDFRTGDIHPIDPRLLDMLCRLQILVDSSGTFDVISGYRSPATNTKLQQASKGVAKKSLHMQGMAIDIRLSDVPTRKLRATACAMQEGGVGYYAKSDFIHLDTGRFRTW